MKTNKQYFNTVIEEVRNYILENQISRKVARGEISSEDLKRIVNKHITHWANIIARTNKKYDEWCDVIIRRNLLSEAIGIVIAYFKEKEKAGELSETYYIQETIGGCRQRAIFDGTLEECEKYYAEHYCGYGMNNYHIVSEYEYEEDYL